MGGRVRRWTDDSCAAFVTICIIGTVAAIPLAILDGFRRGEAGINPRRPG